MHEAQPGPRVRPRLLVVAHGTASPLGSATTARLVAAVAAARPDIPVDLCHLDVAEPRLPDVLDDRPTILVPALLSTGYHVQTDIPAAVAPFAGTRVARHLGPDPLLVDALVDRLAAEHPTDATDTVALVGSGSSRPEAMAELRATAELLAGRLARPVTVVTMGRDLPDRLAEVPRPTRIATYLLAEGHFLDRLREAASATGAGAVAAPLGVHPAVVDLVWKRYDEVLGTR
jgi:sirohydrochlorin ferrochelatase